MKTKTDYIEKLKEYAYIGSGGEGETALDAELVEKYLLEGGKDFKLVENSINGQIKELFLALGNQASYHLACDYGNEWQSAGKYTRIMQALYDTNPDLSAELEEMNRGCFIGPLIKTKETEDNEKV